MARNLILPEEIEAAPDADASDERKRIADEIGRGGYDEGLAKDYYNEAEPGIDSRFYEASRRSAADYGKRGLGSSGMALGAQGDQAFQAAAQKQVAAQKAVEAAKAARRQSLLDEYGIWSDFANENSDLAKLRAQDEATEQAKILSIVGLGLGA